MSHYRAIFALVALVALAACRSLPLPAEFDLLESLGDAAAGEIETPIAAGATTTFSLRLPTEGDGCLVLDDDRPGVTIENGRLSFGIQVEYDGPELSGSVTVQPYVAASEGALSNAASAVGEPIAVDLTQTSVTVAETVALSRPQLDALNDGRVCWSVLITGDALSAAEDGTATIAYEVRRLHLRVGFSIF